MLEYIKQVVGENDCRFYDEETNKQFAIDHVPDVQIFFECTYTFCKHHRYEFRMKAD